MSLVDWPPAWQGTRAQLRFDVRYRCGSDWAPDSIHGRRSRAHGRHRCDDIRSGASLCGPCFGRRRYWRPTSGQSATSLGCFLLSAQTMPLQSPQCHCTLRQNAHLYHVTHQCTRLISYVLLIPCCIASSPLYPRLFWYYTSFVFRFVSISSLWTTRVHPDDYFSGDVLLYV